MPSSYELQSVIIIARSRLEAIRGHLAPATTTPTITIEQDAEIPSIEPTPEFVKIRTVFPPLELEERPIDDVRRLRVAVVGAGVSGITAGILFPVKVPKVDLVIYERESDVVCDLFKYKNYIYSLQSLRVECGMQTFIQEFVAMSPHMRMLADF